MKIIWLNWISNPILPLHSKDSLIYRKIGLLCFERESTSKQLSVWLFLSFAWKVIFFYCNLACWWHIERQSDTKEIKSRQIPKYQKRHLLIAYLNMVQPIINEMFWLLWYHLMRENHSELSPQWKKNAQFQYGCRLLFQNIRFIPFVYGRFVL